MVPYEPFFAGQVYMVPDAWDGPAAYRCPFHPETGYVACIADIFSRLMSVDGLNVAGTACTRRTMVSGLMYHHMDMFVNPHRVVGVFDTRSMWASGAGLVSSYSVILPTWCSADAAELARDEQWSWWADSKNLCLHALDSLYHSDDAPTGWSAGRCCRGHVDLYYVPVAFFARMLRFMPYFDGVFHEVAIPTLLRMTLGDAGSDSIQDTSCAGSAWTYLSVDLSTITCGHRVNLSDTSLREELRNLLRPS